MKKDTPTSEQSFTYEIMNSEGRKFLIKFILLEKTIEILINEEATMSFSYKAEFKIEHFQQIHKFFRQFDSIIEVYDFFLCLENPEKQIKILDDDKFINLEISLPMISKSKVNNFKISIPQIDLKDSDLIVKLCHEIKKLDVFESKFKFIFECLGKTEEDFEFFEKNNIKFNKTIVKDSKIINSIEDFKLIKKGVQKKLNKRIKNFNLLYRASRDGDNCTDFHSKCDNKLNTVTFIKDKNGKIFGGFANQKWNQDNNWISDSNAFIFSLDNNEIYYYSNNGNQIYGSSSNGPIWGDGNDIKITSRCLSFKNSITKQSSSFDYKGKKNALTGEEEFQVEDYETYEIILDD